MYMEALSPITLPGHNKDSYWSLFSVTNGRWHLCSGCLSGIATGDGDCWDTMNIHHWVLFHLIRSIPAVLGPLIETERKNEAKLMVMRQEGEQSRPKQWEDMIFRDSITRHERCGVCHVRPCGVLKRSEKSKATKKQTKKIQRERRRQGFYIF